MTLNGVMTVDPR